MFRRCTSVFIRGVTRWWCNARVTWRLPGRSSHPFPLSARLPQMSLQVCESQKQNKTSSLLFFPWSHSVWCPFFESLAKCSVSLIFRIFLYFVYFVARETRYLTFNVVFVYYFLLFCLWGALIYLNLMCWCDVYFERMPLCPWSMCLFVFCCVCAFNYWGVFLGRGCTCSIFIIPLWQPISTFLMCFCTLWLNYSVRIINNRQQRWIKRAINRDEGGLFRHRKPCFDTSQMIKIRI